jgi:phosphonate transport system substrate-binding protein
MQKRNGSRAIAAVSLVAVMIIGMIGCSSNTSGNPPASNNQGNTNTQNSNTPVNTQTPAKNTSPINVVWYPNESGNTYDEIRVEVARLIEQATGRKVNNVTTTDYTIAIESIASGSADIAMAMGAVGYIEAKIRNPEVNGMFVNADKHGKIDEAKYFSWLCVNIEDADNYKSGDAYSIDDIKGKMMSFVSNSSTSGFRVPTSLIISHFVSDNLSEDDLLPDGKFFKEVYFGGSHQGSAVNLVSGNVDVAAFCDIELAPYIELKSGEESTVGAVYVVKQGADAPFDQYTGKEFVVIASSPVFNGPNVYNPKNFSADEIEAIITLFTSEEVANNELLFYDASVEGALGLYKLSSSYGYIRVNDSWYDPYR